jgi:hypothetical protein
MGSGGAPTKRNLNHGFMMEVNLSSVLFFFFLRFCDLSNRFHKYQAVFSKDTHKIVNVNGSQFINEPELVASFYTWARKQNTQKL